MKFIIQKKFPTKEYYSRYIDAFHSNKLDYEIGVPKSINSGNDYYVIGSIEFLQSIENIYDIGTLRLNDFYYSQYTNRNQNLMLNSNYFIMPWWYLKTENALDIIKQSFSSDKIFIRPDSGDKVFNGTTLGTKHWSMELDIIYDISGKNIPDNCNVIVAPYNNILAEYRAFISRNKIIDISEYINSTDNILDFKILKAECSKLLAQFKHNILVPYTMDFCITSDNTFHILEINSAESAAWYDMDYSKNILEIVKCMA